MDCEHKLHVDATSEMETSLSMSSSAHQGFISWTSDFIMEM